MALVMQLGRNSWTSYCNQLERKPLLTKALTAATGFALGDLIAQATTSTGPFRWDYKRTARLSSFGLLVAGPIQGHLWFNYLDKKVASANLSKASSVVAKVLLDQTINAPIGTAAFFCWTKALEGRLDELPLKIQADMLPTIVAGWKLWLPAHVINFGLVPLQQRVLYTNTVAIAWTYILSQAANKVDAPVAQAA